MKITAAVVREKSGPFLLEEIELEEPEKRKYWFVWWVVAFAIPTWYAAISIIRFLCLACSGMRVPAW